MTETPNDAPLPGTWWLWEPNKPHAREVVLVLGGEHRAYGDWWVQTISLSDGKVAYNTLDRFDEAVETLEGTDLAQEVQQVLRERQRAAQPRPAPPVVPLRDAQVALLAAAQTGHTSDQAIARADRFMMWLEGK